MNAIGFYNIGQFNTNGPNLNTNSGSGGGTGPSPPIGDAFIYNETVGALTTNGLFPVYTGENQAATSVSAKIFQTPTGITIDKLLVSTDIQTGTTTSLNNFISNVSQVISNAFSVNVNP